MDYLMAGAGLAFLFLGGEALVRGAVSVARHLGLSALLIGLTVVGFGTSMPELMVSAGAALSGSPDIALGNVVGSNIANILLIVAISALLRPMTGWQKSVRRDAAVMTGAALVLLALVHLDTIDRLVGLVMVAALAIYLASAYFIEKRESLELRANAPVQTLHQQEAEDKADLPLSVPLAVLATLAGLGLLLLGADLLVTGAVSIARTYAVPEAVIGLTLVAVGTSLPELATSVVAAVRKHSDVAIGNVVGSNIFNILGILGTTAIIAPVSVASRFSAFDVPVMVAVTAMFAALLFFARNIGRSAGGAMLVAYILYSAYLFTQGGAASS